MVRVIYRWRVQEADESRFKAAWSEATKGIRGRMSGARGSTLLQSSQNPTEFVAIARWTELKDWRSFWEDSDRAEMKIMHSLAERLSVEAFEEIGDHTV